MLTKTTLHSASFGASSCIRPLRKCSSPSNQGWQPPRLSVAQTTTFAELSMGLAHTLATIPNRQHSPVLFRTGAQSKYLVVCTSYVWCLPFSHRCTAPADDLDGGRHPPRSKEHTEIISAEFKLGQLWDNYGLVGDIIVSIVLHHLVRSISYLS